MHNLRKMGAKTVLERVRLRTCFTHARTDRSMDSESTKLIMTDEIFARAYDKLVNS